MTGLTREMAEANLELAGLSASTTGDGLTIESQSPAAGTRVERGSSVSLVLAPAKPDGTRERPYVAGSSVTGSASGKDEAVLTVGNTTWDAWEIVRAENRFNDPPPDGSVYVLVEITVKNIGSAEAVSPAGTFEVDYVTPDGRSFEREYAVIPNDLSDLGDLYEGGEVTGNQVYLLPVGSEGGVWAIKYLWSDPIFVAER